MSHYEVLGVDRDASTSEIRAAFRRLARDHHPDTSPSGSAESLAPINEAWRVLGDPVLRHAYDRSLEVTAPSHVDDDWTPSPSPVHLEPPAESSFPWRFLMGMAVVGTAFVLFGVFTYKKPPPGPPDNVLQPGSCVVIEDNLNATEVNCETDHDGIVESLISADARCPVDLEPHRDSQGLGIACIRFDI